MAKIKKNNKKVKKENRKSLMKKGIVKTNVLDSKEKSVLPLSGVPLVVSNIKDDVIKIKTTIKKMANVHSRSEIIMQIAILNGTIKKVIENFNTLKNLKNSINEQIVNGSFFDWNEFVNIVLQKASKHSYVTQNDREKLEDFAKILQAPAFCDPLDYDAYLRWTVYSVNKDIGITSYIARELKIQKDKFEQAAMEINAKRDLVNKAMLDINSFNTTKIIKTTSKLITGIKKITEKKKLSTLDLDKIIDKINDVCYELKI